MDGTWWPAVKMGWVQGESFTGYIVRNRTAPAVLRAFAAKFAIMVDCFQTAGVAHGDLQHGNVLVVDDTPVLVDYDGMYVPALKGRASNELGHQNYQHPGRQPGHFGVELDNFSCWVVFCSLLLLGSDPGVWERCKGGDECLLFRKHDFERPDESISFRSAALDGDRQVRAAFAKFREALRSDPLGCPKCDGAALGFAPAKSLGAGWIDDFIGPPAFDKAQAAALVGIDWVKDHRGATPASPLRLATPVGQQRPVAPALLDCIALMDRSPQQIAEAAKASQKAWADFLGKPVEAMYDLPNGLKLEAILVPPGTFLMGSDADEESETPAHRVTITKPYYLGRFPITQDQYHAVAKTNPSAFSRTGYRKERLAGWKEYEINRLPVETVTWLDVKTFCNVIGRGCRLPTEAEWEYACRAGTQTDYPFGEFYDGKQANCNGHYPGRTITLGPYLRRPSLVGSYSANGFGLFDMIGNVWEWCEDYLSAYNDVKANKDNSDALIDPLQSATQPEGRRVVRGGSWNLHAKNCRSAYRIGYLPIDHYSDVGFRVCFPL